MTLITKICGKSKGSGAFEATTKYIQVESFWLEQKFQPSFTIILLGFGQIICNIYFCSEIYVTITFTIIINIKSHDDKMTQTHRKTYGLSRAFVLLPLSYWFMLDMQTQFQHAGNKLFSRLLLPTTKIEGIKKFSFLIVRPITNPTTTIIIFFIIFSIIRSRWNVTIQSQTRGLKYVV